MTFGRRNLRFRIQKGFLKPLFLSHGAEEEAMIKELIKLYESSLGSSKKDFDFEQVRYITGDDRLAAGLTCTMRYFYRFKPSETSLNISPDMLRSKVFEWVNRRFQGFIPTSKRDEALKDLCKDYFPNLDPSDLNRLLWADDEEGWRLARRSLATVKEVTEAYNFEVLDTLMVNSSLVRIRYIGERDGRFTKGNFIKQAVRYIKQLGLLYDAWMRGDMLVLDIFGPRELFGKPTKYGRLISEVVYNIINFMKETGGWLLEASIFLKGKDYKLQITPSELPAMKLPERYQHPEELFDSQIEERFYWTMKKGLRGWSIYREPEPLIIKDHVLVPDFMLKRGGKRVFIEVVGFWRREYVSKKEQKLKALKEAGFNDLILLMDLKNKELFEPRGFQTLYYSRRGSRYDIPYGELLNLLDQIYPA